LLCWNKVTAHPLRAVTAQQLALAAAAPSILHAIHEQRPSSRGRKKLLCRTRWHIIITLAVSSSQPTRSSGQSALFENMCMHCHPLASSQLLLH
jgi:hypothetical protein